MENWILLLLGLLSSFVVSRYVYVQLFICPLNGPEYKATYTFPVGVTTLWWFAPVNKLKEQLNATLTGNVWAIYPIFVQKIVQLMYFDHKKVAVLITQLKNTRGSPLRWIHTASDPANSHQLHGRTFVSDIGSPKFPVCFRFFERGKTLVNRCTCLPSKHACLLSLGPCLSTVTLYLIWLQRSLLLDWLKHGCLRAYCDLPVCCCWTSPFHSLSHPSPSDLISPTTSVIRILHRIKTSRELFLYWFLPLSWMKISSST